jgi:hypothetical protein
MSTVVGQRCVATVALARTNPRPAKRELLTTMSNVAVSTYPKHQAIREPLEHDTVGSFHEGLEGVC